MRLAYVLGTLLLFLPACSVPYDYSGIPRLEAASGAPVAIGVQDRRPYVVTGGKAPNFVGLQRGGYGNPFNAVTQSGKPLAEDFAVSIVNGLVQNQVEAVSVSIPIGATREEAIEALVGAGAKRSLLVYLNEWKSDTFVHINLVYDLSAEVLDGEGEVFAESLLRGAKYYEGSIWDPRRAAQATIPLAYEQLLASLLNENQIVAALDPSSSTASGGSSQPARASTDHGKVRRFLRYNQKVLARLSDYNKAHKIGQNTNASSYKVLSVDAVDVLAVDGNRATVTLDFTVGRRTDPSIHKHVYDIEINYSDVDVIGDREFSSSEPQTEIVASTGKAVTTSAGERPQARRPADQAKATPAPDQVADRSVVDSAGPPKKQFAWLLPLEKQKIERYFDRNERRARSGLRKYNERHNIARGGYYDDHRIMLINSVEVVEGDGQVFRVKVGLSVGNLWASTYFKYLYTARLVGKDLHVLDHKEL